MIILRSEETRTLPMQTGMGPAQYAGEGRAEAQAGAAIANVADRALNYAVTLNEAQRRADATNALHMFKSTFENGVNEYFYQWDKDEVQKGHPTDKTLATFTERLSQIEVATHQTAQEAGLSDNPYFVRGLPAVLAEAKKDALLKARAHANKSFIEIGRTKTNTQLDSLMNTALLGDATGDHGLYVKKSNEMVALIEAQVVNGLFTRAEADKMIQERYESLEEKRGYQQIARNPEQFLLDYHSNKYPNLDPKVAQGFVSTAEQALARKVELKERERKLENESRKQYAITLKNELISKAMDDPAAALSDVLRMENRLALGDDFDNTVSTLRSLADPAKVHDDKPTLRNLSNEIERNPSPATYKNLDRALQNGKLSGSSYMSMTHRLTERIEKLKDRTERERHDRTNLAVSTYQPMLRVTGINDFDQISQGAQQLFEDELRFTVEQNKAADPMIEGRRLMIKYLDYVSDHAETFGEAVVQKYGFKSPAEVAQAYQAGKITRTEADVQIWYFSRQSAKPKDSASSTSSNLVKKK